MQATTCFHDDVTNPILQEADVVLHHSLAFHAANSMFNPDSDGRNPTIQRFLRWGKLFSTRFLLGLDNRDAGQDESLEALILIQTTTSWQGIARQLRQALIRRVAFTRVAQEENVTGLIDHKEVFERVALLFATVILVLLLGIFRALDRSFGPIVHNRGDVEASSDSCRASIVAKSSAVRTGRSFWSANAWFNTGCSR